MARAGRAGGPGVRRLRGIAQAPPAKRRALSREGIVAAALRVVDDEGVDAVTMRRVAEELGTGAASLYAHVQDKEELLEAVFDAVLAEMALPDRIDGRNWQRQVKQIAIDLHEVLLRHRDIARVAMGRVPIGPNALAAYEVTLAILRAGKLDDDTAALAADMIVAVIAGSAYEASLWMARGNPEDYSQQLRAAFESLPVDRYPTIVSMVDALLGDGEETGDERFAFKLDVLIAGLGARARRRRSNA